MINLIDIKRNYNAIFSLGQNCWTSTWLQRNKLRPFSGVVDWMFTPCLKDVNRLLNNRFQNFLELQNLSYIRHTPANFGTLVIRDTFYNIDSAHDFSANLNSPHEFPQYPAVKEKFSRRIERFLKSLEINEWTLFVRIGGTYEEVTELEKILSGMVKHNFCILLIVDGNADRVTEVDWGLKHTCVITYPLDKLYNDIDVWKMILNGITVDPYFKPSENEGLFQ